MDEGPEHIAFLIDRFLEAEKTLVGEPAWSSDMASAEMRIRWPILLGDSISEGVLCLSAYPDLPTLKFTIALIYRSCVARLDYIPSYEWHDNPSDRGQLLGWYRVHGPHYHSWADNRYLATAATPPKELLCARPLTPQVRQWDQALRWFCDDANILLDHTQMIDLPRRERLA